MTNETPIRPLNKHILVKRIEADEKTAGGIIIPESAKEKPVKGVVLAVGNGRRNSDGTFQEPWVKPGQVILYSKYAENIIEYDGKEFLMIHDQDIFGVVEE